MPTGRREHLDPSGDEAAGALLGAVREIVSDLDDGDVAPAVTLASHLEADLGLDSLAVAELLVRSEELFGVSLDDATLVSVRTPDDLLGAARAAAGASGMVPHDPAPRVDAAARYVGRRAGRVPVGRPARRRVAGRPRGALRRLAGAAYGVWVLVAFAAVSSVTGVVIVLAPTLRLRWWSVRGAGRALSRLTGVRVVTVGAQHLPRDRPFVLAANHASHVDPLVLVMSLDEPAVFAAVADLAENPLVRLGLRRMHAHLVGRGDRRRSVADVDALTRTVRAGRSVVFFPEGRRSPAPGLEPFRTGAFLVAARTGAPVVPVALRGTRTVFPVGRLLPRRSTVTVTVLPPVTTDRPGWQGAVELRRETRRRILQHAGEPDLA